MKKKKYLEILILTSLFGLSLSATLENSDQLWFGDFSTDNSGWTYHEEMEWIWTEKESDQNISIYSDAYNEWFWTGTDKFPDMVSENYGRVHYISGSGNSHQIYSYSANSIVYEDNIPVSNVSGDLDVMITDGGIEFVRTPDSYFEDLPYWPFDYRYVEIDGLRQAYTEAGPAEGPVILLLHGQPSWSYLYRKMIPLLADQGYRVIAMDHLGMGRSDKPIDLEYHTFDNHVDRLETFIETLGLRDINAFVQDWGSLIGLNVIGNNPEWFSSVAAGNGYLPLYEEGEIPFATPETPEQEQQAIIRLHLQILLTPPQQPEYYDEDGNMIGLEEGNGDVEGSDYFGDWIVYARNFERFEASDILESQTYYPITSAERAAWDAPFPNRQSMAAPRTFPGLANTLGGKNQSAWEGLLDFDKPFITIWGGNDRGLLGRLETQEDLINSIPGASGQDHVRLPKASHFLQDDQGLEIARRLGHFIRDNSKNPQMESSRGSRYCEILLGYRHLNQFYVQIWGSQSLNSCPQEEWEALNSSELQAEYEALYIELNGPRLSLPDYGYILSPNVENRMFESIEMRWIAWADVSLSDLVEENFYADNTVHRSTVLEFWAGSEVYELTSPDGSVYVMQSMSQQIDPELGLEDLSSLGSRLQLPDGWTYQSRILEQNLVLVHDAEDNPATVLADDLRNSYTKL